MASNSRKTPLRQAAEEFVKDHLEPRSRPKDRALMQALSPSTSAGQPSGSTLDAHQVALSDSDDALVRAVMAHHGWTYEEARERLELSGM
jgi:hypothetical protein